MSDAQLWDLVIGFFMPLVVAVVIQTHWDERAQAVAMFICCLIVTALEHMFIVHDLGWPLPTESLVHSLLVIVVATVAFYKGLWKPVGTAPFIEERTTLRSTPP